MRYTLQVEVARASEAEYVVAVRVGRNVLVSGLSGFKKAFGLATKLYEALATPATCRLVVPDDKAKVLAQWRATR